METDPKQHPDCIEAICHTNSRARINNKGNKRFILPSFKVGSHLKMKKDKER